VKYVVLMVVDEIDPSTLIVDEELVDTFAPRDLEVVGVFKAPTQFCDPSDGHRGKKTQSGFTRGKKYGWWVCAKCKKPTRQWGRNLNAVLGAARNLLGDKSDGTG
jgi:hypothetical protein